MQHDVAFGPIPTYETGALISAPAVVLARFRRKLHHVVPNRHLPHPLSDDLRHRTT